MLENKWPVSARAGLDSRGDRPIPGLVWTVDGEEVSLPLPALIPPGFRFSEPDRPVDDYALYLSEAPAARASILVLRCLIAGGKHPRLRGIPRALTATLRAAVQAT